MYWELGYNLQEFKKDYMLIEVKGKLGVLIFLKIYFLGYEDINLWVFVDEEEWEHQIFRFSFRMGRRQTLSL